MARSVDQGTNRRGTGQRQRTGGRRGTGERYGTRERRGAAVVGVASLICGLGGGISAAWAVSAGPYSPANQDCPANADANTTQTATPGCHNSKLLVTDSAGHRYVQVGTVQEAQGDNVHAADVSVTPNGSPDPGSPSTAVHLDTNYQPIPKGQCGLEDIALYPVEVLLFAAGQSGPPCSLNPTMWALPTGSPSLGPSVQAGSLNPSIAALAGGGQVYFGGDDNLDSGEHDGVDGLYHTNQAVNGPSDGGGLNLYWQPGAASGWAGAIQAALAGSPAGLAQNPVPVAGGGGGACADGICAGAYSSRRTVYQGGGGSGQSRDVYNYNSKTFGPYTCNSGSPANEKACSDPSQGGITGGMNSYRQAEASNVVVQPGVQVYADPDPQGSPVLPSQLYPLPAVYVGTCGVVLGGGGVGAPPSPLTNHAGQLVLAPTGC
ncbi:MAG: hypothetical protein ACRD0I_05010 [Acidimicrobiales bacterium]